MFAALLAAISFGAPGPVQHRDFSDSTVRATMTFRISPDRYLSGGDAGVSPSISSGNLTIAFAGRTRIYDLTQIFPIREERIIEPEAPPAYGCGMTQTLSRRGGYLVIEAVLAQKGCAPLAAFVDLKTGVVAEPLVIDYAWDHRFDARPEHFDGRPFRVRHAETVTLTMADWGSTPPQMRPWPFVLLDATDEDARAHVFAYCLACSFPAPADGSESLPTAGSTVLVGMSRNVPDRSVLRYYDGERVLFLGESDELRYDARQTPTPPEIERRVRRNTWFQEADDDAASGRFLDAVRAFATMLTFEDDAALEPSESKTLLRCERLAARVRAGVLSATAASSRFTSGC
jgi:hypothetical protein